MRGGGLGLKTFSLSSRLTTRTGGFKGIRVAELLAFCSYTLGCLLAYA